jgi:hypothetical protein
MKPSIKRPTPQEIVVESRMRKRRAGPSRSRAKKRALIAGSAAFVVVVALIVGIYITNQRSPYDLSTVSAVPVSPMLNYTPACMVLNQPGGVYVTGSVASPSLVTVKSVTLWWKYNGSGNSWYQLNDLALGSTFSTLGNFSHTWNPPSVNYYDFEANWTLTSGQVVTMITTSPLQVVGQGSSCP